MPKLTKSYYAIHGASAVPEYTKHLTGHDNGLYFRPTGFGAKASQKPGTDNWFHLSIPTPVVEMGQLKRLSSVQIIYNVNKGASVQRIHIRMIDGAVQPASAQLIQDYAMKITNKEVHSHFDLLPLGCFVTGPVVISLHVYFEADGGEIWFLEGGMEFEPW